MIGNVPPEWGSFASFLGAAVFPVGLILVILAGGELLTGNMMSLTLAVLAERYWLAYIRGTDKNLITIVKPLGREAK